MTYRTNPTVSRTALVLGALLSLLLTLPLLAGTGAGSVASAHTAPTPTVPLMEDDPGWDCGKDGNGVCGLWADASASAARQTGEGGPGTWCAVDDGPRTYSDGSHGWTVTCGHEASAPEAVAAAPRTAG